MKALLILREALGRFLYQDLVRLQQHQVLFGPFFDDFARFS